MLLSLLPALYPAALCEASGDSAFITAPRVGAAPAIDGHIGADEWRDAAAVSGWVAIGAQALAEPNTVAYLCHDQNALYVACYCFEPERSVPRAFERRHDDRAFEDDCVQVFVAPEDPRAAQTASISFGGYDGASDTWYRDIQAYYEFTVNAAGSRTEARNDVRDWDVPWEAAVSRDAEGWAAEIAIPFAAFGLSRAPEDAVWGLNLFRNRPSQLSGWVCPAFGGYRPLPLGAVRLVAGRPVVRQTAPPTAGPGDHELWFEVRNPGPAAAVTLNVVPTGAEPVARRVMLPAGVSESVSVPYRLGARYAVYADGDEVPLLVGEVPYHVPPRVRLWLRYFALAGEVRADVQLPRPEGAAEATLTLQPAVGAATTVRADLAESRGDTLTLPVTGEPGDSFTAHVVVGDAAGTTVEERSLKFAIPEPPLWRGTQAGLPLGVLPPWTPIAVDGKVLEMLGKRLTYRELALPASITSAGAELLAEPMQIAVTADGQQVRWQSQEMRIREQAEDRVVLGSTWTSPGLTLTVTSTVEYDGFCWNEVTLAPTGSVSVERVALEIPMRKAVCRYAYEGHAQAGHALSPLGVRRPIGPNLWLGDEERGIAWLAESLEWVRAQDRARQVEVIPGKGRTLWRSTFIDTPTTLTEPYTARFALHITPAKPVSLSKSRIYHGAFYGMESAPGGGRLSVGAQGRFDPERGTFECWIKPAFDTEETYDPDLDRSRYNRQFLHVRTSTDDVFILYYNADTRNLRYVIRKPDGSYPVILSAPGRLPSGRWSYVGLSWGERLRLRVNREVVELDVRGTVAGSVDQSTIGLDLGSFAVDEVRLSRGPRALDGVPEGPLAADADTLLLDRCEAPNNGRGEGLKGNGVALVEGEFGMGIGAADETLVERLARDGKRIVIFHERWSRFQGYPDLEQVPKLKRIADACHRHGMLFLVYFNQSMSTAAPEWEGFRSDLLALPESKHYHRDDVPQDCYTGCVNGPYGELLLDGIARLTDEAGIDGVYMDGTTVPWNCSNPTHPGCGTSLGDGTYLAHQPIRATREFMKRLRSIFVQRRGEVFLDAHTGGCINIATQSFTDGYYDGEQLARYKPGFRLSPDTFLTSYMGKQFGVRGDFLPNRHTMDQALAISLIHDTATRGQPAEVDQALAPYEDADTRFIGYWEDQKPYSVKPARVLGSLYMKSDRALLVLGSQTEEDVEVEIRARALLDALPQGAGAWDAVSGEALPLQRGTVRLEMPARSWRLVEFRR